MVKLFGNLRKDGYTSGSNGGYLLTNGGYLEISYLLTNDFFDQWVVMGVTRFQGSQWLGLIMGFTANHGCNQRLILVANGCHGGL